jgi:hypothetical protein
MAKTTTKKKPKARSHRAGTELLTWRLTGKRFDDHGVDLRDLADLALIRSIIMSAAKQLWRDANPVRANLPPNFDDRVQLKLFDIEEGSAMGAVYAFVDESDAQQGLPNVGDVREIRPKVVDAARAIVRVLKAVDRSETPPADASREFVSRLADLRGGLAADEAIALSAPGLGEEVAITPAVATRLREYQPTTWEDVVDVRGVVTAANLRGTATIEIDGKPVDIRFSSDDESKVTRALHEHEHVRLHVKGRGEFDPETRRLKRIGIVEMLTTEAPNAQEEPSDIDSMLSMIEEVSASVPREVWDTLPKDGAANVDHYVYGLPKRQKP